MAQSTTLFVGMDVHQETIAVAEVAQEPDAAVTSLRTIGTHQRDIATRIRMMPSKAQPLICLYAAGLWG